MKTRPANLAYILPNIFTAASIFTGIFSIISAINSEFEKAAWLILLSLVFDGLDGRVARLTNTCSRFGIEFDSLADIVAFGVAPALLMYLYAGYDFGRFGIVASALFVIFGAVRLARFNVSTSQTEPSVFIGIPIPTAAVFISLLVLFFQKYSLGEEYGLVILFFALLLSFLMVSNIRYPSFKKVDTSAKNTLRLFIAVLFLALVIFIYPVEGFLLFFVFYILYGAIRALALFFKHVTRKDS